MDSEYINSGVTCTLAIRISTWSTWFTWYHDQLKYHSGTPYQNSLMILCHYALCPMHLLPSLYVWLILWTSGHLINPDDLFPPTLRLLWGLDNSNVWSNSDILSPPRLCQLQYSDNSSTTIFCHLWLWHLVHHNALSCLTPWPPVTSDTFHPC